MITDVFPSRADIIDLNVIKQLGTDAIMLNASLLISDNFESALSYIRNE